MDTNLKNKIVIVTGGASGIGKATIEVLVEESAIPIIVDKDEKRGREFSDILTFQKKEYLLLPYNLTDDNLCRKVIDLTIDKYKKIDALINNAGGNDFCDIDTTSPAEFRGALDRNLTLHYSMTYYVWPHLKETQGNIVFVGSKVSLVGEGKTTAYAVAKAGLIGLTRELATKSANEKLGIRVNCIIPAEVNTESYQRYIEKNYENPEEGRIILGARVPFGKRPTTPREVANVIVFIASNNLSSHTTGQLIFPDGGYVHLDRNI